MAARATVVVVDQWALVRLGIGTVIRSAEMRVVDEAATGADGLLAARSAGADLLVVGLIRDLTQVEVVRAAGAFHPAVPVLALTDQATREQLAGLFSAGAQGVFPRSAESDGLALAVRRVLAGERAIAPSLLPALIGIVAEADAPEVAGLAGPAVDAPNLTTRERQVLRALSRGLSNREIADRLYVSEATVKTHLSNLYTKLEAGDRHDALARAVALGVLQ